MQHASGDQVWAQHSYNKEVDVFSLGIVLFNLLTDLQIRDVKLVVPVRGVSYGGF
jgi:hypothetical protein